MKIPGLDINRALQQAQAKQAETQQALENDRITAMAGGGMVSVTINGLKQLLSVNIDESVFKDGDREMLQDLLVAAVNEAGRKADENAQRIAQKQLMDMMGGMGLGGLM